MKLSLSLKRNKATCKGVFVVSIWFYYKYNVKLPEPGVWVCNHARLLDPGAGLAWLPDPGVGFDSHTTPKRLGSHNQTRPRRHVFGTTPLLSAMDLKDTKF